MRKKKLDFRVDENGCFIPTSHRFNKDGYCYFYHGKREQRVHRLVYEECFGEIPHGLVVRHKCDVRSCINPEHLEVGTNTENMRDAIVRGRNAFGERNGSSVINDEIARKIKLMLSDGLYPTEIARTLGITKKVVRGIKENNTWKHVSI